MRLDGIPRIALADLPTALDDASRLAEEIGLERLLIKRDDNTGLAMGGNKARKLEYLMAEAQAVGADIVLACGGAQSNHIRMTAAAARKLGMECVLFIPHSRKAGEFEGNLLIDAILGAEMRFLPGASMENLNRAMAEEEARLSSIGRTPYLIPLGGSTPLGAVGYVDAVREVSEQLRVLGIESADMVVAVGTVGTLSGLIVGNALFMPESSVYGVSVVWNEHEIRGNLEMIASETASLLGARCSLRQESMRICDSYIGTGYGIPTQSGVDAILLAARTEGLILDPVYTGKAMAGLIDLARKGEIGVDRPVLFWHTGGAPALFAFEEVFHDEAERLSHE